MLSNQTKQIFSLIKLESSIHDNPLELFYNGIKSQETKTAYTKTFREFLDSIEDFEGTFEEKAKQFADFAQKEPDKLKQYAIHQKQRSEKPIDSSEYLSPSTIPNKFKGIKKFLRMNEIAIEWTNIDAIFPEIANLHQTRGYTTDEIRQILDYSTDVTGDFLILAESSSGMRIGGWENQVWGNIRPIYEIKSVLYTHDQSKSENGRIVCASMIVYNDTSSKYLGLISIEAWDKLQSVRKYWIKKMGREPNSEDPIIITRFKDGRQFSKKGI